MIVRYAQQKDLAGIFELYKDYEGDNLRQLDIILNKEIIEANLRIMLEKKCIIIAETENKIIAGIAGMILPCGFTSDMMFMAMFFFVHPNKRQHTVPFIKEIERLLKGTQITRIVVSAPASVNGKMDRFYSMLGYHKLETHYYKKVG